MLKDSRTRGLKGDLDSFTQKKSQRLRAQRPRRSNQGMATEPKTAEEMDEEELREVEGRIKEVVGLMTAGHDRGAVDEQLSQARERRDEYHGDMRSTYHITKQGHAATTFHTQTKLALAETLKLRIQLGKHARKLDDSLQRLSVRYVNVLERVLKRARY